MSSSSRALNAILPRISVAPYEAHQKARTFGARYVKSGQYDTAIDVIFESSRELLKAGQTGSGVDLAGYLIEIYELKGEAFTDESKGRFAQLIALTEPTGTWRKTLIEKTLAWSAKLSSYPTGDPDLHQYIGELLYKEGDYEGAEPHFLAAGKRDSARLLAEMFSKWLGSGGTPGAFAVRAVIPYLLNGNILAAKTFLSHFISAACNDLTLSQIPIGSREGTSQEEAVIFSKDSELNFAQMAIATCERAQGDKNKVMRESWVRLCGKYQAQGGPAGILSQPEVRKSLQEIAELYFAIPSRRPQGLGDMMSTLLGGPGGQQTRRMLPPVIAAGPADLD